MSFMGFNHGVNIIAYKKNNHRFGMCAAWCMLVDYDKAMMLLGEQSDTGNNIEKGDIIGISGLSKGQKDIALHFGNNHSLSEDKFALIDFIEDDSAILIPNAKTSMVARVIDIIHTNENPLDNLIYVEFIKTSENENVKFLSFEEMR